MYGRSFTIYTDHEPLTKELKLTDATGRVTRQRLYLEQFDFKLIYKKGKQNVVADGLSRIPRIESNHNAMLENELYDNHPLYGPDIINKFRNQLIIKITNDEKKCAHLLFNIFPDYNRHVFHQREYNKAELTNILKNHLIPGIANGIFAPVAVIELCVEILKEHFNPNMKIHFCNLKLPDILTQTDQESFIEKSHNFNHRNWRATYDEIQKSVFFPDMIGKVKKFVKNCQDCRFSKYERKPFQIPITRRMYEKPFENVFIDVYVKEGEKFLTVIDSFSKFAQVYKISNETADELISALIEYFKIFGFPKMITCDQATAFRSAKFRTFTEKHNIALHFASTSNSNGIIERFHNTLLEMYLANREKVKNLTLYEGLSLITALYNDAKHATSKLAPKEIIFGNSSSLNSNDIQCNKQQTIQTARENIAHSARLHNSKILPHTNEYENISSSEVLVKSKAKPSPYGNRYRMINIKSQTDKTVTDETDIKTHKRHMKK